MSAGSFIFHNSLELLTKMQKKKINIQYNYHVGGLRHINFGQNSLKMSYSCKMYESRHF